MSEAPPAGRRRGWFPAFTRLLAFGFPKEGGRASGVQPRGASLQAFPQIGPLRPHRPRPRVGWARYPHIAAGVASASCPPVPALSPLRQSGRRPSRRSSAATAAGTMGSEQSSEAESRPNDLNSSGRCPNYFHPPPASPACLPGGLPSQRAGDRDRRTGTHRKLSRYIFS